MMMFQCRFRRENAETVGWIEQRAARVGTIIKLDLDGKLWRVTEVYTPGVPEEQLQRKQELDRNSLSSVNV